MPNKRSAQSIWDKSKSSQLTKRTNRKSICYLGVKSSKWAAAVSLCWYEWQQQQQPQATGSCYRPLAIPTTHLGQAPTMGSLLPKCKTTRLAFSTTLQLIKISFYRGEPKLPQKLLFWSGFSSRSTHLALKKFSWVVSSYSFLFHWSF